MKLRLLIASVCLNLLLGAALFCRAAREAPPAIRLNDSNNAPHTTALTRHLRPATLSKRSPANPQTAGTFDWASIESQDYPTYIANLQAVGCPQNTIADIIAADLEAAFSARMAAIPAQAAFWTCGQERERAQQLKNANERELEDEKRAAFASLCGSPWPRDEHGPHKDLTSRAITRFLAGPVSNSQIREIFSASRDSELRQEQIRDQAMGILLPEDERRLLEEAQQTREELERILSPSRYAEFIARIKAISLIDGTEFENFPMTPAEFREICLIHNAVFGCSPDGPIKLFGKDEHTPEQQAEFNERVRTFLGDERFTQLRR